MNEHLFKLKKDGKTVGYLKIEGGRILWQHPDDREEGIWIDGEEEIYFDTAYLFVTKDKNSKDVFVDDFVWFHWQGKKSKAKLINDNWFNRLISCEKVVPQGLPRTFCKSDKRYIELIEDKANA